MHTAGREPGRAVDGTPAGRSPSRFRFRIPTLSGRVSWVKRGD